MQLVKQPSVVGMDVPVVSDHIAVCSLGGFTSSTAESKQCQSNGAESSTLPNRKSKTHQQLAPPLISGN